MALLVSFVIYYYKGVRAGGYMMAPVSAYLILYPISVASFLIGCVIVRWIVDKVCQYTLTIGLKRYFFSLTFTTFFVWTVELFFLHYRPDVLPFQGSNLLTIIAMLSYVNDSIIYKDKKVIYDMVGSILMAVLVILAIRSLQWSFGLTNG